MNELGIIRRQPQRIFNDRQRVLAQFFLPGDENRCRRLIERILLQPAPETRSQLEEILAAFGGRHFRFESLLLDHFNRAAHWLPPRPAVSLEQKLLIGSYFTKEYSIEAAALFNPSMAPHPNQGGVAEGQLRYIQSLRATGEGHISSVAFASGTIDGDGRVLPDARSKKAVNPILSKFEAGSTEIEFDKDAEPGDQVIFPITPDERNGIEDVRLVSFAEEDGSLIWYGTYTAYDGRAIRSKLLRTTDFHRFVLQPLMGAAVQNKGMALFPRKIDGRYAMISRLDGENLYHMSSETISRWESAALIQTPEQPWECVQLGNCGSPIETSEGWLLLSHSVGPMRTYVISAYLLDLNDPTNVIGRLPRPLLSSNEDERDGYVPNVVYSCGSLRHGDHLIIPYAMSDYACGFASVDINKLMRCFV